MKRTHYLLMTAAVAVLMASVTLFTACEKDNDKNDKKSSNSTPKNHNVELVYGQKFPQDWQNISMDTLNKYNADPTVDTIFMVPEYYGQFSTLPTTGLQALASELRERHNVNPNKIFGKGELQLANDALIGHFEIAKFFRDTLGYNVTFYVR